jgi:hypothetical protein
MLAASSLEADFEVHARAAAHGRGEKRSIPLDASRNSHELALTYLRDLLARCRMHRARDDVGPRKMGADDSERPSGDHAARDRERDEELQALEVSGDPSLGAPAA